VLFVPNLTVAFGMLHVLNALHVGTVCVTRSGAKIFTFLLTLAGNKSKEWICMAFLKLQTMPMTVEKYIGRTDVDVTVFGTALLFHMLLICCRRKFIKFCSYVRDSRCDLCEMLVCQFTKVVISDPVKLVVNMDQSTTETEA